ncbi:uncharacterized protein PV09_04363 [Verruconis gallopava]|uniref:Uncharacterized protein n=1 Tax=Verruconis gallopava TaxID=253628 RepID=A0A0D1XPY0_9PEZI|nr:uncharacterized protein PV09_04363 [Verruconis gallopava]KIW04616.1 hypothetical protein PV09_04363 [Verruconis gallopava]
MSDILSRRTGALDRLLAEFDEPPPVPPKDDKSLYLNNRTGEVHGLPPRIVLPRDAWDDQESHVADEYDSNPEDLEIISESEDSAAFEVAQTQLHDNKNSSYENRAPTSMRPTLRATTRMTKSDALPDRRKKVVTFAQDHCLEDPSEEESEGNVSTSRVSSVTPQLAHRFGRSRDGTKRKPAPLNLSRPTSHTGQWKVLRESELWTPIDDEPNTAAIIAMDIAPKICPLPYKPIRSFPLKPRGSMRPAPLRIRKGVRFDSIKSPSHLPLKSPALTKKLVRFDVVKSPAVAKFRTPPTPYSNTQFQVLTPRRKRSVHFEKIKSPASSKFKIPPTPYRLDKFEDSLSIRKRQVRFDAIKSPARSHFTTPPTPYYKASFATSSTKLKPSVRFASLKSPAVSSFRIPPTPYKKTSFNISSSPPDISPVTPRAMHIEVPEIEPDSPIIKSLAFRSISTTMDDSFIQDSLHRFKHPSDGKKFDSPLRTTLHRRNSSLPKEMSENDYLDPNMPLSTKFNESAVGASTLRWLGMLPKTTYRVNQNNITDRNKILGSYFHKTTPLN